MSLSSSNRRRSSLGLFASVAISSTITVTTIFSPLALAQEKKKS